jgi:hypothetical protein
MRVVRMQRYFEYCSLVSKISWSEEDAQKIAGFFQGLRESQQRQQEFFQYAKKWRLAPWIYLQMDNHGISDHMSIETRSLFFEYYEKIKIQNEKRNDTAKKVLAAFEKEKIDAAVLKGNLFGVTIYGDSGYKKMNDFDMLVHREDWEKIQEIYFSMGFIPLGFGWSGEKQKAAKFSHTGTPFISADLSCVLGTQWGLKSPSSRYHVNLDEAWATSKELDFYGVKAKQLLPEYNLLHLILHLGIYKCGIRDLMDIYNVYLAGGINDQHFVDLLGRSGAREKGRFAIELSAKCCSELTGLANKLSTVGEGYIERRLSWRNRNFERTGDLHDSYNDYFQDVEKLVIYFNLFPEFHKKFILWLRIVAAVFYPKTEMVLRLNDMRDEPSWFNLIKARVKSPYLVFALIAEEIGWQFTFLLFLKLIVDLPVSLKNYFFRRDSYFDYLRKKGVDPESIKRAVKSIE